MANPRPEDKSTQDMEDAARRAGELPHTAYKAVLAAYLEAIDTADVLEIEAEAMDETVWRFTKLQIVI